MADEHLDRDAVKELWKRGEDTAAAFQSQGDSASRFYTGAITAAAGWFATNAPDKALAAVLVLCLGVVGTGHVAWYQFRWFKVHRRARFLAGRFAALSGLAASDCLYDADDKVISLLRTGQPISGAIFSGLALLAITIVYAALLALAPFKA